MNYRVLGKTGLKVSEIGFGGDWMDRHSPEECRAVVDCCIANGINILDCWMAGPQVRSSLGSALEVRRDKWIIQGHIGSTWQDGQYKRSRELSEVIPAFEDLLTRLKTDYIDLGMIHYVDEEADWAAIQNSPYMDYVMQLKAEGKIRHIGMSTHNPIIARKAALSGIVEMIMFSVNPAFDLLPAFENVDNYFVDEYDANLGGIAPERALLYNTCLQENVGITVMKGYAGGRLFDEKRSPFGVALTPIQCLHYALTRPAVSSVMVGFDTPEHVVDAASYCEADSTQRDYASVLASAPRHSYSGQCTYCGHCLPCPMQIDIAMVNKLADLALMQSEVPASLKEHYLSLERNASDCVSCGQCESNCPFGVKISEKMAATAELFEK